MKIARQEFLDVLQLVQPALAKKEVVAQSTSFVFSGERVYTYNDEIAISHPVDLDLRGAVQAEGLIKLLSKLKDEEVSLEVSGGELLVIGKRSKAGLRMEESVTLPVEELGLPERWDPLPEGFSKSLAFCGFSASRDMAKPVLNCIHVTGTQAESCDNFRLTRRTLSGDFSGDLLLPAPAAKALQDYDPSEYGLVDGWAHFRNGQGTVFSARTYEGEYPNLDPFLTLEDGVEVKLPEDLGDILDRAGIFSKTTSDSDESVNFLLEGKFMTLRGEGDSGWFEEKCPVRWSGKETVRFSVHPNFLRQTLGNVGRVLVSQSEGRLLMEGEGWTHVMLLVVK